MGASRRHRPLSLGLIGLLVPLACTAALPQAGTTALAPAPAAHELDWRTSPLDLNLRGLNGERFRFHCPPGKPLPGQVTGSGPYTDASAICPAAVHAGAIRAASGGFVTIELLPGQAHYVGSLRHYVQSEDYEPFWSGSYRVVAPAAAARPP